MRVLNFFIAAFAFMLTLGIIAALAAGWRGYREYTASVSFDGPAIIEVQPGSSVRKIAVDLHARGIISNPMIFIIAARLHGYQTQLKAGEYEFLSPVAMPEILRKLVNGEVVQRFITFREGMTSYEIVRHLHGIKDLNDLIENIPAEGTLLPETYDYQRDEDRQQILERMRLAMKRALDNLCVKYACTGGLFQSRQDVVTLASLIEKETGVAEERRRVAGVFVNRLKKGIRLQTDPTVIYALNSGKHQDEGMGPLGRRLLRKDLEFNSPYNTYLYAGLPPGPIANPGLASLEAALNPEEHDYIYFVADGTGGHIFSKTLAEHNRNVAAWRRLRSAQ